MRIRAWLCFLGVALLLSGPSAVFSAGRPTKAQTSAKVTSKKRKGKPTKSQSKSKRQAKSTGQKAPTPDRVKDIQTALQRQGAYDGEPSGKWDDSTVDAMKKYQDKNGLNPTGKIDAPTLNKLGLGSETAGKGAPFPTASSTPTPDPRQNK